MVWEETHVPKVVGSNPSTVYWMDIYSHSFVVKLFEKTKMNEKRPGRSLFKKVAQFCVKENTAF